jgi:hypothetical protein
MPTLRGFRARGQGKEEADPAPSERRLLSGRTGLILLSAFIAAVIVGVLTDAVQTYAVQQDAAQAVLAGLCAFGGAVTFFDRIIGTRWE